MSEISVELSGVAALETKTKIAEEKQDGEVVDRVLVTTIKFEVQDVEPGQLRDVLWALRAGHLVNVTFHSPQSMLESVTFKSSDKEVSLGAKA